MGGLRYRQILKQTRFQISWKLWRPYIPSLLDISWKLALPEGLGGFSYRRMMQIISLKCHVNSKGHRRTHHSDSRFLEKSISPGGWEALAIGRCCKNELLNVMQIRKALHSKSLKISWKDALPRGLGVLSCRQMLKIKSLSNDMNIRKSKGPTLDPNSPFYSKFLEVWPEFMNLSNISWNKPKVAPTFSPGAQE